MSHILALDTSGTSCSVALWKEGSVIGREEFAERQHTQRLLPMIKELLAQSNVTMNQLDAIAYGRGPGSFTGIRIAAGVAQGLAFGLNCPVIPVSTLAAQALRAHQQSVDSNNTLDSNTYVCSLDARMGEVYWGEYAIDLNHADIALAVVSERVCDPAQAQIMSSNYVACGSGMAVANMPEAVLNNASHVRVELEPRAEEMAHLAHADFVQGRTFAPEDALPVYLRDEVTWKKLPRYQTPN